MALAAEAPSRDGGWPQCRADPLNGQVSKHWSARSQDLAKWTMRFLVNRSDCYGSYLPDINHPDGTRSITTKLPITASVLAMHYTGGSPGKAVGLHTTHGNEGDGTKEFASKWALIDIDWHEPGTPPLEHESAAISWYQDVRARGYDCILEDSNGNGGFHLWLVFAGPVPTEIVKAFADDLASNWKDLGLSKAPEVFPKQVEAEFGNWVRLPGRHPKHPTHWSRIYDGEDFVSGDAAINLIEMVQPIELSEEDLERYKPLEPPVQADYGPIGKSDLSIYVNKAIDAEIAKLSSAVSPGRNNALNSASFSLAQFDTWPEFDRQEVQGRLRDTAIQIGLSEREADRTISSGWNKGTRKPRARPQPRKNHAGNGQSGHLVDKTEDGTCVHEPLVLSDFGVILSEVQELPVKWLADQRLAAGKIHLTIGPGGVGKSTCVLAKLAAVTVGGTYPGGAGLSKSGKVAILAVEDGKADTIKPRFVAAGGDPGKVLILKTRITKKDKEGRDVILYAVFKDLDYWRKLFDVWNPIGLGADPIQAFMGRGVNDSRNSEVRDILEPFAELLDERGVFLEAITHTPKKIESANAAEMAISSVAYPNISRIVHVHWNDPDLDNHYLITQAKNSLGKKQSVIGYTIQEHRYEIAGQIFLPGKIVPDEKTPEITERELLQRNGRAGERAGKVLARGEKAIAWLEERFREMPLWPSDELKALAKTAGISNNSLWCEEVKALPIKKENPGGPGTPWYWRSIPPWPPLSTRESAGE